jgi:hypothetical protein
MNNLMPTMPEGSWGGRERPTAYRVAMDIRRRILDGEFLPGDKIGPQALLSEHYNCANNYVVSHAIKLLKEAGMVVTSVAPAGSYGGTFVSEAPIPVGVCPKCEAHLINDDEYYPITDPGPTPEELAELADQCDPWDNA